MKLGKENQYDFRNLPCHVSRNVIKQVSENIKSWIRAKKEYEKHPDKFQSIRIQITRRAIAIVRITAETSSQFFLTYFSTVICYFRGQIPM